MKTISIIIEIAEGNLSAYIKEVDGITATGNSIPEIKSKIEEAIEIYKATCEELGLEVPNELKGDYVLNYKLDMCSFLNVYARMLPKSALEALTGINQKQLWHYASGKSKPRPETVRKVSESIHAFAEELSCVEFV